MQGCIKVQKFEYDLAFTNKIEMEETLVNDQKAQWEKG